MPSGKKPTHLSMTGGKSQRQQIWEALRKLIKADGKADTYTVARRSNQTDNTVRCYLYSLERAGVLARSSEPGTWLLLKDEGVEAPRVNKDGQRLAPDGYECIWRALRITGELNAEEAVAMAAAGGTSITEQSARVYLQYLANAGYLARTDGIPGKPARYTLIASRNTGPLHPVYQRIDAGQLFDPNIDRVVWTKGEQPNLAELNGYRIEAEGLRALLREWMALEEETAAASPSLVARTREQLEAKA